jgi:SAM-dependent methyltransferase
LNVFQKGILYARRNALKTFGIRSGKRQLLASGDLSDSEKRMLERVSLKVHHRDSMYSPLGGRHYLSVGLSAVCCIDGALGRTSKKNGVRTILDFPCGYGRVLRFLKIRFPEAAITGVEIIPYALHFCEKHFDIAPVFSRQTFSRIQLQQNFDLIWCGSLITHLDENAAKKLLHFFYKHLNAGGVCVFTTHGQASVDWIREKKITYKLSEKARDKILAQFDRTGFGYVDYEHQPGYGVSVASRHRIGEIASEVGNWQEIFFRKQGWDNHQDVYGFSPSD